MASRRRSTTTYDTYGSVAYAPAYDGSAVRAPRRREEPVPKPKARPRHKALTRAQVRVREAGKVAPFAVVGFAAVAVFAVLLVMSYAQLTVANGEMVSLRRQLSALQEENVTLTAQYERVFDLDTIQEAVGDTMVRPTSDQVVYIDLSEPDTVVVHAPASVRGMDGALRGVEEIFESVAAYFR